MSSMAASVEIVGVPEVLANLERVTPGVEAAVTGTFYEGGQMMLNELAVTTPVRTGYLRSRNQVRILGNLRDGTFRMEVFNDASYSLYIEVGNRFRAGRHFLWNAAENGRLWMEAHLRSFF